MPDIAQLLTQRWEADKLEDNICLAKKERIKLFWIALLSFVEIVIGATVFRFIPVWVFIIIPVVLCIRAWKFHDKTEDMIGNLDELKDKIEVDTILAFGAEKDATKIERTQNIGKPLRRHLLDNK